MIMGTRSAMVCCSAELKRFSGDLRHCETRIEREESLAAEATSPEAACIHQQLAMLYRSQLAALKLRLGHVPGA